MKEGAPETLSDNNLGETWLRGWLMSKKNVTVQQCRRCEEEAGEVCYCT